MSTKRAMLFALTAATISQASIAEERKVEGVTGYERRATDNWTVQGISYPTRERNDACVAFKVWKDGSKFELVKDLKTGELRIWHQTMGWNRINDDKLRDYTLRMNFYDQQGNVVDGGEIKYRLVNKNTFYVANIDEKRFMKAFVNANRLTMIPEGNVSNTQAFFDGRANDIAVTLADCVQASARASAPSATGGRTPIEPPSLDLPLRSSARASL